jgi:hypothetical protein
MSLIRRLPSHRRTSLELQVLERIGDAHYALGAMVESALAYETESALAAGAGLVTVHVQAQSSFARPLGLLDPDRAIAVLQEAAKASAGIDDPITQSRVALLAAGMRLLYDGWNAEDVHVCEAADQVLRRPGHTTAAGFDRAIYAHVQALRGDAVAALRDSGAGIPESNEALGVTVHLLALSAQILTLLQVGRFGDALRIIRDSQKLAEKNGSIPGCFYTAKRGCVRSPWTSQARNVCATGSYAAACIRPARRRLSTGWPPASKRPIRAATTTRGDTSNRSVIRWNAQILLALVLAAARPRRFDSRMAAMQTPEERPA